VAHILLVRKHGVVPPFPHLLGAAPLGHEDSMAAGGVNPRVKEPA
jgi:hypothetical protein